MAAEEKKEQAGEVKLRSDRVTISDGRYLIYYSFDASSGFKGDEETAKAESAENNNERG